MIDAPEPADPTRGWRPDPSAPGRERWWTGSEWSNASHKAASPNPLWPAAAARLFWPGVNRGALIGEIVASAAALLFFTIAYIFLTAPDDFALSPVVTVLAVGSEVVAVAGGAIAVAAIVRSRALGAVGLAICSLVLSVLCIACVPLIIWIGLESTY